LTWLMNKTVAFWLWIGFLGALVFLGVYAAFVKFTAAGEIYGTTQLVPLGILISTYIFFAVTGTGLCIIASLGHVFGIKRYANITRRGVFLAIITLLCGFFAIGLELERPFRLMAYIFTSPQLSAPIWWMGFFYSLCLVFLLCEFGFLLKEKSRIARFFGLGAFTAEICATLTLGAIFGVLIGRPYWYGVYMPIYFLLSAVISGVAFLICFTVITYYLEEGGLPSSLKMVIGELGQILAIFLGISLLCIGWKIFTGLYGKPSYKYEATLALLRGPLSLNFWLFEVVLGSFFPFLILSIPYTRTIGGIVIAAVCVIFGMFAIRYDSVIVGQIFPVWGGPYANYAPNHVEWFIVAACSGACLLCYTLGAKFLPLKEEQ